MNDWKTDAQIITDYETVIAECDRFLERAKVALKFVKAQKYASTGNKDTAAAKRASMDLTRALAEIRRCRKL